MNSGPLSKVNSDDVVELHPKVDVSTPFKGCVMDIRSKEAVLKPTEHGLDGEVLGINIHMRKDRFSVLVKEESSKDTRVYTLDSLHVYDSDGETIYTDSIHEGDIVYDENSPHWSDDNRVEVTGVTDQVASEYQVDEDSTIADLNPDYPSDDTVVEGTYSSGGNKEYAFPASRLCQEEEEAEKQ